MRILKYDLNSYDFPEEVRRLLGVDDLQRLRCGGRGESEAALYRNMQEAKPYRRLMRALSDHNKAKPIATLYRRFVAEVIAAKFDEPILYQLRPTFRMLFPDIGGQSRFHRDRDYGHHPAEINYSVALTPAFGSNAIWIESSEGAEDYRPIDLNPGEIVEFDGASLRHGALHNETGCCRVSFDFRVVPVSRVPGRSITKQEWITDEDPHCFALTFRGGSGG